MDETVTSLVIGTFIDKTANLISGTLTRKGANCPIDSVEVKLVKHYVTSSNKTSVEEISYSDAKGVYTYSVNPFEQDLESFEVILSETRVVGTDTIKYNWDRNNVVIARSEVSALTPAVNFEDLLVVKHQFSVRNSCDIFPNTRFTLELQSTGGCFSTTLNSNQNGSFSIEDLPPLEFIATVTGASPLTSDIIPVIEYLKVRPLKIDLSDYKFNTKADSAINNEYLIKVPFIYHNSPLISFDKGAGIDNVTCNTDVYFVRGQGDPNFANATLNFKVEEIHNGTRCHVKEGYLIVKNGASDGGAVRIDLNQQTGEFNEYTFRPGIPETIAPFFKTMTVEYHLKTGFVSQQVYSILVTGKAPQPGSDVIVTSQEEKGFEMPLAVLRDPPGDNSYSYLEKGVETTKSFSVTNSFGGSLTLSGNNQFGAAGIGIDVRASAEVGGNDDYGNSIEFTQTTTERFQTSDASDIQNSSATEYFVGDNADLIIGTGLALKYGIVEAISYDPADTACKVLKQTEIGISPDKLTTNWVYTVSHIEALVAEYENLLDLVRQDRVVITDNSGGETAKDSNFYKTLIANWNSVLHYHKTQSAPHLNLCGKGTIEDMFNEETVPSANKALVKEMKSAATSFQKECFCNLSGDYDKEGVFIPDTSFKWTDDALKRYQVARKRIGELKDYYIRIREDLGAGHGYTPPSLDQFDDDNLDKLAGSLSDEDKLFAENITFSGQASIEKTFSTSYTSSQQFTQQIFGAASLYAGIFFETEFEVSTWGGIGAGIEVTPPKLVESEISAGVEIKFDFNIENSFEGSTTTTETSGYVLGDDDAGDQFSVTIIKGLEQMHTPYFDLFAGRSSCPYEPGTIPRDRPEIQLEYPNGSPFENNVLRDVNVEDPAFFALKLVNKAPEIFNEYRYYSLVQAPNSNQNGAQLTADGSGQYYPLVYKIKSGGSTYTGFYANKAGISYDYPDLNMQLIPTCLDEYSDIANGFDGAELHMEAYFERPCSDISILSPQDNWRIFKSRDEFGVPSEKLLVQIGDYDPYNEFLEKITLNYRRIGSNVWVEIPSLSITKDSLQRYFELNKTTYKYPTYNFIWDILDQQNIIDGEYELQAIVHCGIEGEISSNVVKGRIDRTSLALFGTPRPTDGVLNIGEDVQVVFNEPVECGFEQKDSHYIFVQKSTGAVLDFTSICSGNSIVYKYNGNLVDLDQEVIEMTVFGVQDLNGNVLEDTIKYEFIVSYNPVAWQSYSLEVDIYKNERKNILLSLVNTGSSKAFIDISKQGNPATLLELSSLSDSILENSTKGYLVTLNANDIAIGEYQFTVTAAVSTFSETYGSIDIPIKVNVLAEAPNWTVPFGKSQSTVVVCNFKMDDTLSTDTMDKIAISIDGEIRGVDNIYKSRAGSNLYYAVINVQGDAADQNKPLEFRIWDASKGAEYDGTMTRNSVVFNGNIYGTTLNPRIIEVDTEWDSVRYIPLIKGWNWLAFNYQRQDMAVKEMVRGLDLTGGEIIKTLSQQAIFNDSTNNWFSTSQGLKSINTANGYLLFLNKDDVLRASGKYADRSAMSIINGWSLIGNPNQVNVDINNAFLPNTDLKDGAVLKTGGTINKASVLESGLWTGGIQEYEVNQAYMIKNSEATLIRLKYDHVSPDKFEYNMTVLGSVNFDGMMLQGVGDYVIAEIDGEVRGKGLIEEVFTPQQRFMLNMFIYGDSSDIGKKINFKIYRFNADEYYTAYTKDSIIFEANTHYGYPTSPYWFANQPELLLSNANIQLEKLPIFVYPNPFKSEVVIELDAEEAGMASVEILNPMGKVVHSQSEFCRLDKNKIKLESGYLSSGIYIIQIRLNNNVSVHKVIKQ